MFLVLITLEVRWLRAFLLDLDEPDADRHVAIYCGNQAAKQLATEPHPHSRATHINIPYHITRDVNESIEIEYRRSNEHIADMLTAALTGPRHRFAAALLQLHCGPVN